MARLVLFLGIFFACNPSRSADVPLSAETLLCDGAPTGTVFAYPTNGFSAAVWARADTRIRSERETQNLVMAGDGWFSGFALRFRGRPDGEARAYFEMVGEGKDKAGLCAEAVPLRAGRVVHLACTWDGQVMRLYIDGTLAASNPYNKKYLYAPSGISCVRFVSGTESGVGGTVSGGVVWPRALAHSEISALASAVPPLRGTERFAELLDRALIVCDVGANELLEAAESLNLSSATRSRIDEALPMSFLNDGNLPDALRAFAALPAALRTPEREIRFADKMIEKGFLKTAREIYHRHADASAGTPWEELARETYAAVCSREKESRLRSPLSCTGGSCPAVPQEGAKVSQKMPEKRIYVSPAGQDRSGDGSFNAPFASAMRARDEVRALKKKFGALPDGGVAVVFLSGVYRIGETLELEECDSGELDAPVVWMAEEGARVVISGGRLLPPLCRPDSDDPVMKRVPEEARGRVMVADVGSIATSAGPIPDYGYNFKCDKPITDLYAGGCLLTPARYPNDGWLSVTNLLGRTVTDSRNRISTTGAFQSSADDLDVWAQESDLRATGYWYVYWGDATRKVYVDPAAGSLSLDGNTSVRKGGVFFLSHAARALDAAGEWYLDRQKRRLYMIEPENAAGGYELSSFDGPFIRMKGCRNIRIEGFVFEKGRINGIEMKSCSDCMFAGNVVRGFGGCGLVVEDGRRISLQENVLRDFGHTAVVCSGGDRRTLTNSGIRVADNDISSSERRSRTYAPGLQLEGCGVEVSNNRFHHIPSSAIRIEGNDHFVVSNLVEDVLYESDDQGAVDVYFDTSYAGTIFGWNVWRRCGIKSNGIPKFCGRAAVRFDGHVSSQTVFCNRFEECGSDGFGAVQINGGRFNTVDNNLFVNCLIAVTIQPITLSSWTNEILKLVSPRIFGGADGKGVDIRNDPYKRRYPHINRLMFSDQINLLTRNVAIGSGPFVARVPQATECHFNRIYGKADVCNMPPGKALLAVPCAEEVGPSRTARFDRAMYLDRR